MEWLRSLLRRRRVLQSIDPAMPVLLAATLAEAVDRGLASVLAPAGFEAVAPRRWVRARPPFRDIVEYEAMKGASYRPTWGISLDFVPLVSGSGVAPRQSLVSKRTSKAARCDLRLDQLAAEGAFEAFQVTTLPGLMGPAPLQEAERRAGAVSARALSELDAVADVDQILVLLERWKGLRKSGLGFENYLQAGLTRALLLHRRSDGSGQKALGAFCATFDIDPGAPVLAKATAAALEA